MAMSYFVNGREGIRCGEKGTCHSQCFWGHLSLGNFQVPHPGQGPDLRTRGFGGPGPAVFLQGSQEAPGHQVRHVSCFLEVCGPFGGTRTPLKQLQSPTTALLPTNSPWVFVTDKLLVSELKFYEYTGQQC